MPRSQTRPKQRRGVVKVKVKPRFKKAGIAQGLQASALEYDPKQTQFANYKELGLLADANQIGVTRNSRVQVTGFNPRVKGASAAPRPAEETHPLELEVPEGAVTVRRVPPGEVQVLRKLIERHGDDYAAMARDKHNTHQHTGVHLRRRVAKLQLDDAEEAAAADAAKAAGVAQKPSRLEPKYTRHPNAHFRKQSRHFT